MVIDAGQGYTFWQTRVRSEQPSFTSQLQAQQVQQGQQRQQQQSQQEQQEQQQGDEQQQGPGAPQDAWDWGKLEKLMKGRGHQSDLPYLQGGFGSRGLGKRGAG